MLPYPHHDIRRVIDLCGLWDFTFLGAIAPEKLKGKINFTDYMMVPQAFDATPAYAGMRGLAAYRKVLEIPSNSAARLRFGAVGMWCRILVDGKRVAEHSGGYTEFWVDIPKSAKIQRELILIVDNQFSYERSPMQEEYFDWYHYGGITRPVSLHILPDTYIKHAVIQVRDWRKGTVDVRLSLGGVNKDTLPVQAAIDGQIVLDRMVAFNNNTATLTLQTPDPRPWSTESPHLHFLDLRLPADDMRLRYGLRKVSTRREKILLNGNPIKLLGVNRHEGHPQFGPAIPPALMLGDLQQLRAMGCNFIRGSHYPQDQCFLDICDETGFLVWEENTGWQQGPRQMSDEHFLDAQERSIDEMVSASVNHPSVIMWGILNEASTDKPESRPCFERLLGRLRELDPTRLITYADSRRERSICLDLVDVVSFNFYPGWYYAEIEDVAEEIQRHVQLAREKTGTVRPFIISEIGAAATFGWRDGHSTRWSEQYQAELLKRVCNEVAANRNIAGLAIWQFCDCRTSESARKALSRPRCFNNKGIFDEYRRPKQAFESIKAAFSSNGHSDPHVARRRRAGKLKN